MLIYHEVTTVVTVSRLLARVGGRRGGEGGGGRGDKWGEMEDKKGGMEHGGRS